MNKLETQTSGQVLYHGKEIRNVQKEINEFRSRVGMVFQSFNLFNNMTVLENCMEGARKVLHVSKEEAFDRAIKRLAWHHTLTPDRSSYPVDRSSVWQLPEGSV